MILNQLREKTQTAHKSVEGTVDVMRPDLNEDHYQRLLLAFYTFYKPLERKLSASRIWDTSRSKLSWLLSDLLALGYQESDLAQLELCNDLPPCETPAQALGIMYVVEGSTLGGQMITKHLRATKPGLPLRFFESYGTETGLRWRNFIKTLEEWSTEHENQNAEIVRAATETFAQLSQWLSKWKQSYQH